jgi:hypothetical protein
MNNKFTIYLNKIIIYSLLFLIALINKFIFNDEFHVDLIPFHHLILN